jgi:hypothetical protein
MVQHVQTRDAFFWVATASFNDFPQAEGWIPEIAAIAATRG